MPVIAIEEKTTGFKKLKQDNLVEQMAGQLRSRILSGYFGPDGLLPTESELSAAFGVSRTVAREAMRSLQVQGLVEVSRGKKSRVRRVDPRVAVESLEALLLQSVASPEDAFEIRRTLEVEIAGLAAERASADDLQAIAQSIKQQQDGNLQFHQRLAATTGNTLFQVLLDALVALLNDTRSIVPGRRSPELAGAHVAILSAVQSGNVTAARKAMSAHLASAKKAVHIREGANGTASLKLRRPAARQTA